MPIQERELTVADVQRMFPGSPLAELCTTRHDAVQRASVYEQAYAAARQGSSNAR